MARVGILYSHIGCEIDDVLLAENHEWSENPNRSIQRHFDGFFSGGDEGFGLVRKETAVFS